MTGRALDAVIVVYLYGQPADMDAIILQRPAKVALAHPAVHIPLQWPNRPGAVSIG